MQCLSLLSINLFHLFKDIVMTTSLELIINETVAVVTRMRAENIDDASIDISVATTLVEDIETQHHGEFINKINSALGTKYTVKSLKALYGKEATSTSSAQVKALRAGQASINNRIANGEILTPEEMQSVDMLNSQFTQYEKDLKAGTSRTEAEIRLLNALGVNSSKHSISNVEAPTETFTGEENSWLQPKIIASISAALGASISIYTSAGVSYETVGAGIGGVAVAYFGTDYLFDKVAFLKTLNPLIANVVASALGMGMGVGATQGAAFYKGWSNNDNEVITDVEVLAIPAATAEMTAWM